MNQYYSSWIAFELVAVHTCRTGDDERRARLINEDGVHLINDSKIEISQHQGLCGL